MSEDNKAVPSIVWNETQINQAYEAANLSATLGEKFKALFGAIDKATGGLDGYKLRFKGVQNNATVGYFMKRMNATAETMSATELKAKALVLKDHGKCSEDEKAQRRNARAWIFDGLKKAGIETPFAKAKISETDKAANAAKRVAAAEKERQETITKAVQEQLGKAVVKVPDHGAFIHALERNAQTMLQLLTVNDWIDAKDPARKLVEKFAKDLATLQTVKKEAFKIL